MADADFALETNNVSVIFFFFPSWSEVDCPRANYPMITCIFKIEK